MIEILAHITSSEVPGFWMAGIVGFAAGVATTWAVMVRKAR